MTLNLADSARDGDIFVVQVIAVEKRILRSIVVRRLTADRHRRRILHFFRPSNVRSRLRIYRADCVH